MLELQGGDIVPGLVQLVRDVVKLCLVHVHTRYLKGIEMTSDHEDLWYFDLPFLVRL